MPYYTDEVIPSTGGMEQFGLQYDPSLSVIFGESVKEGLRQITPHLLQSYADIQYAGGTVYEDEEQWKASEFFREGLKFEERMTEGQARLLAERHDSSSRYANLLSRVDTFGDYGAMLGGVFLGSIPDPINFIPWLGFIKKGKQAKSLIDATTRTRAALRGGLEAAIGTAAFHPLFALEKGAYQEEYDISMALQDVAIGAGIGGGLGFLFGRIHPKDPDPAPAKLADEAIPTDLSPKEQLNRIREQVRSQVWRGLDHVPPQTRIAAVSLAHAQMASGQTVDAARFLNQVEIDTSTMDGAPSGLIRGSFQDSVLNNEDGTLQTWYHGTVQRPNVTGRTDAYETILPGDQTNGLISFTSDAQVANRYAEGDGYSRLSRAEDMVAYEILQDEFPDVFEFDRSTMTGKVLQPNRLKDEDVWTEIFNNEPRGKFGRRITGYWDENRPDLMAKELEDGFQELASGGVVYPRFLNVKNPYPELMDFKEAEKLGAEWFKERGYDAVRSTEEDGKSVIFTVDPNQSKSIYDPEFTQFNEATSADPLPPVDETPVRNEFELEEENIDLEIAARESELTEQDAKDLAEMDQMVADVDRQAQAYRAVADCVMRT